MSAIIAEKQIVIRAIDKATGPIEKVGHQMEGLSSKISQYDQKLGASAVSEQSFKTAMAELKASTEQTNEALGIINHTIEGIPKEHKTDVKVDTQQANQNVTGLTNNMDKLRKVGGRLKDFVAGNLIANGISNAANAAKGFAEQGFQAALASQEVAERWHKLGMTQSEIKATGAAVADLKENTNMSGVAVGNLVTRFYGMTGSAARAQALAKGVGSITDALKLSQQASDAFANGLTRIEASGKVTSQSLGRLEKQAPGLTSALQKASGMSKQAFDNLLSSGKMTADQFNDILARASKDYRENAKDWDNTTQGALHNIKQTWADSWKAMMAPLTQSSASGLGALSKSLQTLQPEFEQLGAAVSKMATEFAKWLTPQHAKDIGEIVSSLGRIAVVLGKGVWNAVTVPLRIIGSAIEKLSGKHGDALDEVADALDHISKNKVAMTVLEGIGGLLVTQFAYGKLFKIAQGLGLVRDGILSLGKAKISGNIFRDLLNGAKSLSKIRINPANWFKGANFSLVGKGIATKLASGISIGLGAVDILRGLTGSHIHNRASMVGKGIGTIAGTAAGMVLTPVLGPFGPIVGSMLGGAIGGKIGPGVSKAFKSAVNFFKDLLKGDWSGAFSGIAKGFKSMWKNVTGWAKDTWKSIKDWWNGTSTSSSHSSSNKSSKPSEKEIRSLGGNHYSRADIANVKAMNSAIVTYTRSLKSLKEVIKHNDPTKSLNSMNKNLKNFIKEMLKSEKPLEKVSKTFKNFGKSMKTISSSMKGLTGKHGLSEFDKDLAKLDKDTKHSKIGEYFERLAKSIKKSKLTDQFKSLTKYLGSMVKDWEKLTKPMKQAEKEFASFEKTIGKLADKKTGLSKVDSDIKTLSKDLKKYDFGKELGKQMEMASKQLQGKHSFTKQFTQMTTTIEKELRNFHRNFSHDWSSVWQNLSRDAVRGLSQVVRRANSSFNEIRGAENRFTSGFLGSWRKWISGVVSSFQSGFKKLAGIAESSMRDIVSRLNRGISAINAIITDFGGDRTLGTIKYASGTSMAGGTGSGYSAHPGGEAVINDGQGPHKQELVWQPSKGWQIFAGVNRHVWLEPGAQIIPAERSHHILSRMGIPHYAYGNLSRSQLDHIEDEFMYSPLDAAKQLMLGVTNWDSKVPVISDLGEATAVGFGHGIANVLKTAVGTVLHAIGGDWGPAISSAARHMWARITRGFRDELKVVIQNESGGIETRIQDAAVDDINMKNGNPAQGLLQYIPQTFAKYAMPGHGNILSGFDQLMAFFNNTDYLHSIGFNSILHKIDWLGSGPTGGRRYANGGHITEPQAALIGDNAEHDEYVINPYQDSAIPLLDEAWDTVRSHRPDLAGVQNPVINAQVIELLKAAVKKLDNINIHPVVDVEDIRKPINHRNGMDFIRIMN